MSITQVIAAFSFTPPNPNTQDQDAFDTNATAMAVALPDGQDEMNTMASQMNALAAAMNALAAGGAMAIPYTFSTTTTDADPGAGFLRLDNATQNIATTIRADLAGADGSTFTDVLATFDDSTSTVKGYILLQALADATKWILCSVSALAAPAGYRNITVAVVASSAASPFANNDDIVLKFSRNGDKGDTGATGATGTAGITLLATLTPTAAANVDALSTFSATYDNYLIIGTGLKPAANDSLRMRFGNAGAADTGSNYAEVVGAPTALDAAAATSAVSNTVTAAGTGVSFVLQVLNANDVTNTKAYLSRALSQDSATPTYQAKGLHGMYLGANAISGLRFYWNGGQNFAATGSVRIYGYKNS